MRRVGYSPVMSGVSFVVINLASPALEFNVHWVFLFWFGLVCLVSLDIGWVGWFCIHGFPLP